MGYDGINHIGDFNFLLDRHADSFADRTSHKSIPAFGKQAGEILLEDGFQILSGLTASGKDRRTFRVRRNDLADRFVFLEEMDGQPPFPVAFYEIGGRLDVLLDQSNLLFDILAIVNGDTVGDMTCSQSNSQDRIEQFWKADAAVADCGNERDPKELSEFFMVDDGTLFTRLIAHVQGDNGGKAQFDQLGCQVEIPLEICRIDYIDDYIGFLIEQVGLNDHLLNGIGGEAVGTGKVDDRECMIGMADCAFFDRDCDAGVIGYSLVTSGE